MVSVNKAVAAPQAKTGPKAIKFFLRLGLMHKISISNIQEVVGKTQKRKFSMAPIINRQLSRQKIRQIISVFVVFETKSV